jgi:signal transduction histidine kinase
MSKEFLRRVPIFTELNDSELDALYASGVETPVAAGEVLVEEGTPPGPIWVILDGTFEVTKRTDTQDIVLSLRKAGDLVGEMAVLEQVPRTATVRALEDSRVLRIDPDAFFAVLSQSPAAVRAVLHGVASRLRNIERLLVQNMKMASLGTLTAGLAHELNNPAAAVARSSDQLHDALDEWQRWTGQLSRQALDKEQLLQLDSLRDELDTRADTPLILDSLERSDREEELQAWLDERGIDNSPELAHLLVSSGWKPAALDSIAVNFTLEQLASIIPWLAYGGSTYSLLADVSSGAHRLSEVVKTFKNYSFLDQAPVQRVDVTRGLEDTLRILSYKLTPGITIRREYAPNLPIIEAYASELNQVWTNIIENALDAMQGKGELKLRAYASGMSVVVEIIDNGPGIPEDIWQQVFDPFFTTKAQGLGTGLGLHIVYNVVVEKHHGLIDFTSRPGETVFRVTLPLQLARPAA